LHIPNRRRKLIINTLQKNHASNIEGRRNRGYSRIINTRSANGGQIDRRVVYCLLIYIMLSGEGKYLKIIIYYHLVIYFVMFYTYDVSNRPIPGNIADNE
jgi:hypothetical protein